MPTVLSPHIIVATRRLPVVFNMFGHIGSQET